MSLLIRNTTSEHRCGQRQEYTTRMGFGYAEKRQFLDHDLNISDTFDLASFIEKVFFRLTGVSYRATWKSFFFRPFDQRKFLGFNTIRIDGGPFLVFFETTIPRLSSERPLLAFLEKRALHSPKCLGLLAISECAKNLQLNQNGIQREITVLHPPQKTLVAQANDRRWSEFDLVKFCFIGRDFARKGGIEMLRAFDKLGQKNWHLTIVSSLAIDDYATQYTKEEQRVLKQEVLEILDRRTDQIDWHESLPNEEVLSIMKTSHVGLLPTWHDTYGYSVLEFQASGCPVISTDIRALPEINNINCGWVIPIGKKFDACISPLKSKKQREAFSKDLTVSLKTLFEEILGSPRVLLQEKAEKALARIRAEHDPERHKLALIKILEG